MTKHENEILALSSQIESRLTADDKNNNQDPAIGSITGSLEDKNNKDVNIFNIKFKDEIYQIGFNPVDLKSFISFQRRIKTALALYGELLIYYLCTEDDMELVIPNAIHFDELLEWNESKEFTLKQFIVKIDEKSISNIGLLKTARVVLKLVDEAAANAENAVAELAAKLKEEIIKAANELIRPAPGILLSEESGIKAALKRPANVVILEVAARDEGIKLDPAIIFVTSLIEDSSNNNKDPADDLEIGSLEESESTQKCACSISTQKCACSINNKNGSLLEDKNNDEYRLSIKFDDGIAVEELKLRIAEAQGAELNVVDTKNDNIYKNEFEIKFDDIKKQIHNVSK
eukprot:206505_1